MAELSPTAQSIVAAFDGRYELLGPLEENWQEVCLAAALRAAVEAKLPEEPEPRWYVNVESYLSASRDDWLRFKQRQRLRREFLALADELEGHG